MIRKMEKKDSEQIYKLGELLHSNYTRLYQLEKMIDDEYTKTFVYIKDDVVLGFIMYIDIIETIDIIDIIVHPDYRNKKIGSYLMDTLFSEIDFSTKTITLEVNVNNEKAINFYQKFGFEIIHKRTNYYENQDAYLMGRFIDE